MPLTLPNFKDFGQPPPSNGIRIICIDDAMFGGATEWPRATQFPPRVGDFLQASSGETKKISQIIHAADENGSPMTVLVLGADNTESTPTEGGAVPVAE